MVKIACHLFMLLTKLLWFGIVPFSFLLSSFFLSYFLFDASGFWPWTGFQLLPKGNSMYCNNDEFGMCIHIPMHPIMQHKGCKIWMSKVERDNWFARKTLNFSFVMMMIQLHTNIFLKAVSWKWKKIHACTCVFLVHKFQLNSLLNYSVYYQWIYIEMNKTFS